MSRIAESLRSFLAERQTRRLMLRKVRSSVRLSKEAQSLTEAIERLLAQRADVALVSEEGWRRASADVEPQVAMLVGSIAYLSSGLVLRLQLLDGRSFSILDEVETVLGDDTHGAGERLADALSALLANGSEARKCITDPRDS